MSAAASSNATSRNTFTGEVKVDDIDEDMAENFLKIMNGDDNGTIEHSDTMQDNRKSLFNTMRMRDEMAEESVDPKYVRLQSYLTGTFHTRLVSIVIVACLWMFALAEYLVQEQIGGYFIQVWIVLALIVNLAFLAEFAALIIAFRGLRYLAQNKTQLIIECLL